jgi:hypothetical protein
MTTTPKDPNRPEHAEAEEELKDEAQTSEVSALGGEQGGADAIDKSTGTAPDRPEQPE